MALQLEIVSKHREIVGDDAVREFHEDGGTIGRSFQNDWILPDPDRFISGKHAAIDCRSGIYYLVDLSSNGVFINGDRKALGRGNTQRLFNGDRLRLGEFEIAVSIAEGESIVTPLEEEQPVAPEPIEQSVEEDRIESGIKLLDEDELAGDDLNELLFSEDAGTETAVDSLEFFDESADPAPVEDHAAPASEGVHIVLGDDDAAPSSDVVDIILGEDNAAPATEGMDIEPGKDDAALATGAVDIEPEIDDEALATEGMDIEPGKDDAALATEVMDIEPGKDDASLATEAVDIEPGIDDAALAAEGMEIEPGKDDAALATEGMDNEHGKDDAAPVNQGVYTEVAFDAFMQGAGLDPDDLAPGTDRAQVMRQAGMLFREFVEGVTRLLASRANLKSTFRLDQAMMLPRHNNPIKLSENATASMRHLLAGRDGQFIEPREAVIEVCRDLLFHQEAFLDAMTAAFDEFAGRFDPDELLKSFGETNSKAKLGFLGRDKNWKMYCDTYPAMTEKGSGRFPQTFAEDFVRCYEQQIAEFRRLYSNGSPYPVESSEPGDANEAPTTEAPTAADDAQEPAHAANDESAAPANITTS